MNALEENVDCVLTKYEQSEVKLNKNGTDVKVIVPNQNEKEKLQIPESEIRVQLYKKRFLVLGIFCLYSMSSAFQWIEYAIITHIIMRYYDVSDLAVAWTSMIYMLSYIPLMFVATWMLDNWGLRRILLLGAALNAVGSLIKIGSVSPTLFALSFFVELSMTKSVLMRSTCFTHTNSWFFGQTIAACAQSFILEIPPKIASLWFGPSEVSTATSIGVFGNQLGCALGFLIPPILVPDSMDDDEVAAGLRVLFISSATVCTIVFFLVFFVIQDQPELPPSQARALSALTESNNQSKLSSISNYKRSIGVLMKNIPYLLLLVSYGINTGTYYAVGTLLSLIISEYHENSVKQIGEIGLTMVVAGLGGSVICGVFLDRTKLYKITTVIIYIFSMIFMFVFTFTIQLPLWVGYVTIGLLGFFMTGYLPIGFEFAAEITYPESEATSSGLLNVAAQVFGILFTLSAQELLNQFHSLAATLFMSVALLVGTVMTILVKEDLKRQRAEKMERNVEKSEEEVFVSNYNENNSNNRKQAEQEDEKLIRLTSASSCYSAAGQW